MAALDVTTRRGWGARTSRVGRPMGKVSRLIVHHFWKPDVPAGATRATERAVMRGVEAFHASKGWSAAPGYQWVISDSGRVYEGVGWGRTGVHTAGHNSSSVAFCFANNGDAAEPTPAAWQAAYDLAAVGVRRGNLTADYNLSGHRDFAAKSCPGDETYPHIGRIRNGRIPNGEEDDMFCRKGDSGSESVELLQLRLRALGFYKGKIDSDYGAATTAAVLAMRKSQGSNVKSGARFTGWAAWQLQEAERKAAVG